MTCNTSIAVWLIANGMREDPQRCFNYDQNFLHGFQWKTWRKFPHNYLDDLSFYCVWIFNFPIEWRTRSWLSMSVVVQVVLMLDEIDAPNVLCICYSVDALRRRRRERDRPIAIWRVGYISNYQPRTYLYSAMHQVMKQAIVCRHYSLAHLGPLC